MVACQLKSIEIARIRHLRGHVLNSVGGRSRYERVYTQNHSFLLLECTFPLCWQYYLRSASCESLRQEPECAEVLLCVCELAEAEGRDNLRNNQYQITHYPGK